MRYKIIQQINPNDNESVRKWYAMPVNSGKTVTLGDPAKQAPVRSLLTRRVLNNTLPNLVNELPSFPLMGRNIQSSTIRVPLFSSSGADDHAKFHTGMIRTAG